MKKVLGLDLGVASIGWAITLQDSENEENNEIVDCGVRIVPLDTDEIQEFGKGGNVPTNVVRRQARGMRRNLQRYRWRRDQLHRALHKLGMMPDKRLMTQLTPQDLYALRERALSERLTLPEIGRVLIHLNGWRGYRSSRKEQVEKDGKKQSDYLNEIAENEKELQGKTIGQYFAMRLRESADYRVRGKIFKRETYMQEFDRIWEEQAKYHPDVLTGKNRHWIRDRIIYWQRPLKSAKGLVGECALEWYYALDKKTHQPVVLENGLKKIVRPKCAPNSSPLAQECKVWESIHNLRIYDNTGQQRLLSMEEKKCLFSALQNEEKNLKAAHILRLLNLSPQHYRVDRLAEDKGLEYNQTRAKLKRIFKEIGFGHRDDLLKFDPEVEEVEWDNPVTGERMHRLQIRGDFDQQPLYQLWHLIYATEDEEDLVRLLQERYGFSEEQAHRLAELDFTSAGYARKSHRAMRRLLPHYQKGLDYTKACEAAGYRHSDYLTKAENEARPLLDKLDLVPKNSLRNPVVEKILNQMVHLVNDIITTYGRPDEICIELAGELKRSARERKKLAQAMREREEKNKDIRAKVVAELSGNIQPESVTRSMVEKWRLYCETGGISLYTGKKLDLATFLCGEAIEVEHIIPKVCRFDDSFSNKTFCEAAINRSKKNMTAHDFMKSQPVAGLQPYEAYLEMLKKLLDDKKISKTKYNNLMMTAENLAKDTEFLQRQLRESQYIAKKAAELLRTVCRQVRTTTGSITDFLRHMWGWDDVILKLRIPQFREIDLVEKIAIRDGEAIKEIIKDWDKRKDHRHHALDALVVACTRQSHVQRINNLNQILEGKFGKERREELLRIGRDKYIAGNAPFSFVQVSAAIENILVSFKQGNRVATRSRNRPKGRKKDPQITLTPRGKLHEETIYGQIKRYEKVPLDSKFNPGWVCDIAHDHQRELVAARLAEYNGDPKKAFRDLDKKPILYGPNGQKRLTHVTVWKYPLVARKFINTNLTRPSVKKIVDRGVWRAVDARLAEEADPKVAFKNIEANPILVNGRPVRRIRVENPAEKAIQLPRGFAETGGNHHIAIYRDAEGKKHEHVVTFWDAFRRVRLGLPVIITDVAAALEHISQWAGDLPELYLPEKPEWKFVVSLAKNDMFVFDLDPKEIDFADPINKGTISKHLFKVRKISSNAYWFLHHLETEILEDKASKAANRCKQCSLSSLQGSVKVRVDRLGRIVEVGQPV
jgi:CRISPR-associated endonuclease Csn1